MRFHVARTSFAVNWNSQLTIFACLWIFNTVHVLYESHRRSSQNTEDRNLYMYHFIPVHLSCEATREGGKGNGPMGAILSSLYMFATQFPSQPMNYPVWDFFAVESGTEYDCNNPFVRQHSLPVHDPSFPIYTAPFNQRSSLATPLECWLLNVMQ